MDITLNNIITGKRGLIIILTMILAVSVLHYTTGIDDGIKHEFYARLYYVPLAVAALNYGLRGGLLTAVLVTAAYSLGFLLRQHASSPSLLNVALDLVVLFGVGTLIGIHADRQRRQYRVDQHIMSLAELGQVASMMAHEIKSPLVAVGGFAHMLLRRPDPEHGNRQKLAIITAEVARLERLVHDTLDFARPRSLDMKCCRLEELLQRTYGIIHPQAEEKNIHIVTRLDTEELELQCDEEQLQQVLINLLDNAIQHTPTGGTIWVEGYRTSTGKARLEIRDSGDGIPEELLDTLFEPFSSGRKGGNGLGLAIAQRIIQAHGSCIEAINLPEGGACFRFELSVPALGKNNAPDRRNSHG